MRWVSVPCLDVGSLVPRITVGRGEFGPCMYHPAMTQQPWVLIGYRPLSLVPYVPNRDPPLGELLEYKVILASGPKRVGLFLSSTIS